MRLHTIVVILIFVALGYVLGIKFPQYAPSFIGG